MGKANNDEEYKTSKITVYINNYHPSRHTYSQDEGSARELSMEGHVDDPGVGPLGDIYENERNSDFSWAPTRVNMHLDNSNYKELSERFGKTAIGTIYIRKNVEVKTFNFDGKEHIDHPIIVWLALPPKLFDAVEKTLKNNKEAGKLGILQLKAKVKKNQVVENFTDWDSEWIPVSVKDWDVSKEKNLELGVFEFSFGQTILDSEQSETSERRVKTLGTKGETTTGQVKLFKYEWSFDTARGAYKSINIEGKMQKFPRIPGHWKGLGAESDYVDVYIEFEEFWYFSEDAWPNKDELPAKSIYGQYSYSHENNNLYLTLACHPKDFDSQIKPLLLRADLKYIWFTIQFAETLNFEAQQNGAIISFSINSLKEEELIPEENEHQIIEKLTNLDDKISDYVQSLEERLGAVEKAVRYESHQNISEIDAIKKQMTKPNDLLSRLVLKIPIIGSILRFLAK